MKKYLIFTILMPLIYGQCCLNCAIANPLNCSLCSNPYNIFGQLICIKQCPSNYISTNSSCALNGNSGTLFDINFSTYTSLLSSGVYAFYTLDGMDFSSTNFVSLIPSGQRGFYCSHVSILKSSINWVLSPTTTVFLWVLSESLGSIFEVHSSSNLALSIAWVSPVYSIIFSAYQQSSGSLIQNTVSSTNANNGWNYLKVQIFQSTASTVQVNIHLDGILVQSTYSGYEFTAAVPYTWSLGSTVSGNSFIGFIYEYRHDQIVSNDDLSVIAIPSCTSSQFISGTQCGNCPGCTWPICVSSSTCSICDSCEFCSGYSQSDCMCDGSTCCQSICLHCSTFYYCTECEAPYTNTNGICNFSSQSPIIAVNFTGDFVGNYGGFITGNDQNYYYFMNNPESFDPIPAYGRGLYFDQGRFLQYGSTLYLGNSFAIGMWVKPSSNGGLFYKGNDLSCNIYSFIITYVNPDLSSSQLQTGTSKYFYNWGYVSLTINYVLFDTFIYTYLNNALVSQYTLPLVVYSDTSSALILGNSRSNYFTGFIYSIKIWNYALQNFAYEYLDEICGKSMISGCLPECTMSEYVDNGCINCANNINGCIGCVDSRTTCTICASYYCQYCSSFDTSICLECIPNASGTPCACNDMYYPNSYICKLCYSRCSTCSSGGVACITCKSQYSILNGVCLTTCPSGYTDNSNTCVLQNEVLFVLDLSTTVELGIIGNIFNIGNNSTNKYPVYDSNDPWPSANRGYYFDQTSYMTTSITISPFFSFSMWFMVNSAGIVLNKAGIFQIVAISTTSVTVTMPFVMNSNSLTCTFSIPINQWVFLGLYTSLLNSDKTYLYVYLDGNSLTSVNSEGFIDDSSNNLLYLGQVSGGFKGFILSASVYSTNTHYSDSYLLYCNGCSTCSTCLSTCLITQDPSNVCSQCNSNCNHGCFQGTCNICLDSLCQNCTSRGVSSCNECAPFSSGTPCKCFDGYYQNLSNCLLCYSRCITCNAQGFWCQSCVNGLFFQDNLCVEVCGSGYDKNGGNCTFVNNVVLNLNLTDAILLGNISGVCIGNNCSNNFPFYDNNDPWPANERGYYFWPGAYMVTGELVLSPSFYFEMWIKSSSNGPIINKNSTLGYLLMSTYLNTISVNASFISGYLQLNTTFNSLKWLYLTFYLTPTPLLTSLSMYINSVAVTSVSISSFFIDNTSPVQISSPSFNYTGFIYYLLILNKSPSPILTLSASIPHSSCNYSTYPPNCNTCPSTCNTTCNNGHCNICPDPLCEVCNSFSSVCLNCSQNSSLINNNCTCNSKYFYNANQNCLKCFENCAECYGGEINNCLNCSGGLMLFSQGICSICALGYRINDLGQCVLDQNLIFNLQLNNTISGIITENSSNIQVLSGQNGNFYPNYDQNDAIAAYLRGFYFNGTSSYLSINDPKFLLPFIVSFDIWINPSFPNGVLFQKNGMNISLHNYFPVFSLYLTNSYINGSGHALIQNEWNELIINIDFTSTMTSIFCNGILTSSLGYFIDKNATTFIGTDFVNYFKGFLYSFEIFSAATLSRRLLACEDSCDQCLPTGYCIPNCQIELYWTGPSYNNCSKCLDSCNYGCRNNLTCNICGSVLCKNCSNFVLENCNTCVTGAAYQNGCTCNSGFLWDPYTESCFQCKSNQYVSNYTCYDCPQLCPTCDSNEKCTSCVNNAALDHRNICACILGYYGLSNCTRNVIGVNVSVSSENNVYLYFSQNLVSVLTEDDLTIQITIAATWTLNEFSYNSYEIVVNFIDTVTNDTQITLLLKNRTKLVSETNGTPDNFIFTKNFHEIVSESAVQLASAKALGQTVSTATTAAVMGISLMNPNPACLWSFINTVQMVVFIVLANVTITPRSKGLLIGLRNYNFFPNLFEYFVSPGIPHHFQNAYDLGYPNDSVLLNVGKSVTAFIFFMVLWGILYVFMIFIRKGYLKKKMIVDLVKEFYYDYKYGFFIRFGITNYIEFEIAALIGLINWRSVGAYSITNTIASSIILMLNLLAPLLCFLMTIKRKRMAGSHEEYDSMYGTLFYEFNDDKGLNASNFYVYFFIKRGVYGVILLLISNAGILQLSLITTICLAFFFYLLLFRPFSEDILNYSNTFTEISTIIIFVLISWEQFNIDESTTENLDSAIYYCINIIMGAQMIASVGLLIKSLISKMKAKKGTKSFIKVTPIMSFEAEGKRLNDVSLDNSKIDFIDQKRHNTRSQESMKLGRFFTD